MTTKVEGRGPDRRHLFISESESGSIPGTRMDKPGRRRIFSHA